MFKEVLRLKLQILGGIIVLLLIIQVITAYIFSFVAQKQLELQFQKLTNSPFIEVIEHSYSRGIFSSNSKTKLMLNENTLLKFMKLIPDSDKPANSELTKTYYTLTYNTHIQHGIFSGLLNGYFVPSIAYAKTDFTYSDALKKKLDQFFTKQPPLSVKNIIYLNKSGQFELYSPNFKYEEAVSGISIVWGGLNLLTKYNASFDDFENSFRMPEFKLDVPTKGFLSIDKLAYNSNSRTSVNNIKVGKTKLDVANVKVDWKDKPATNIKFGDILSSLTGISSVEFLNNIDSIDSSNFELQNVSYLSDSFDEKGYFSADAIVAFQSLITKSKKYGPMYLDLKVDHILSAQFSQMLDHLSGFASTNTATIVESKDQTRNQLIEIIKPYFGPILMESPIISLNKFELNTPDGLIYVTGRVTSKNFMLSDMDNDQEFLKKISVDLDFTLPKSVLAYLFLLQMKYLLSIGNAQMDESSSEALVKVVNILLDNQVNNWIKKGYLKNSNNMLSSHLTVQDGVLHLNGKAVK